MTTKNIGQEGFTWFIGTVEDRNDPQKLGRVRVRPYNLYSQDKALVPTTELPWAIIMMPPTNPSSKKVGWSSNGLTVGSTVIGFFMDGNDCNQPIIMGTMHGIPGNNITNHDMTEPSREINSIKKDYAFDEREPASPYAAKYPYNKVLETESGHFVEVDDTPGQERLHIFHKSGTYTEIDKDGRKVDKVVDNHIEIVLKDQTVHIIGNVDIKVDGNYTLNVDGDIVMNGKTINLNHGTMGAARIGDTADTGDDPPGVSGSDGSNKIETGSGTVFIGD